MRSVRFRVGKHDDFFLAVQAFFDKPEQARVVQWQHVNVIIFLQNVVGRFDVIDFRNIGGNIVVLRFPP